MPVLAVITRRVCLKITFGKLCAIHRAFWTGYSAGEKAGERPENKKQDWRKNMLRQYITQGWMLQIRGEEERIPAQVPGSLS